jgi:hypothetical protein
MVRVVLDFQTVLVVLYLIVNGVLRVTKKDYQEGGDHYVLNWRDKIKLDNLLE